MRQCQALNRSNLKVTLNIQEPRVRKKKSNVHTLKCELKAFYKYNEIQRDRLYAGPIFSITKPIFMHRW